MSIFYIVNFLLTGVRFVKNTGFITGGSDENRNRLSLHLSAAVTKGADTVMKFT